MHRHASARRLVGVAFIMFALVLGLGSWAVPANGAPIAGDSTAASTGTEPVRPQGNPPPTVKSAPMALGQVPGQPARWVAPVSPSEKAQGLYVPKDARATITTKAPRTSSRTSATSAASTRATALTAVPAASVADPGTISGIVTEAPSGLPLAGVLVTAFMWDGNVKNSATSDAQGRYTITGLPAGTYEVRFDDYLLGHVSQIFDGFPGSQDGWEYDSTPVVVAAGATVTGIDAALALGGVVTGRVTAADGTPIEGVCVSVWTTEGAGGCTGPDGVYRTTGIPAGETTVLFEPTGPYLGEYYDNTSEWEKAATLQIVVGQTISGIDAVLDRGATISGTVTDAATGLPLEGIHVRAEDASYRGAHATTDAHGRYTTTGLPTGTASVWFRDFTGRGYLGTNVSGVSAILGQDTPGVDAQLTLGGQITGRITDPNGAGITTCVHAELRNSAQWSYASGCADATGTYTIVGLPTGDYQVNVNGDSTHVGRYYRDALTPETATLVAVTEGRVTPAIDQALPVGATISGLVTDAVTGAPVANLWVAIESTRTGDGRGASTGLDGRYTISALDADTYRVRFGSQGQRYVLAYYDGAASSATATPVPLTLGQAFTADATLAPNGSIAGRVTDTAGNPVRAGVRAYSPNGSYVSSTSTEADGTYTLYAGTGDYKLNFSPYQSGLVSLWYRDKAVQTAADTVHVVTGTATTGIDQALTTGGLIQVDVTGNGAPLTNATARIYAADGSQVTTAYPDDRGRITTRLPSGAYRVEIGAPGWINQFYDKAATLDAATPLTVTDGQTTPITVDLLTQGTVSGHITGADGAPLKGCVDLYIASQLSNPTVSGCSDDQGAYSVKAPAGPYVVKFRDGTASPTHAPIFFASKASAQTADIIRVTDGVDTPGVDAQLALGGFLTGTLTQPHPTDYNEVSVYEWQGGNTVATSRADASGAWKVGPLPTGTYRVQFAWYDAADAYQWQYYDHTTNWSDATQVLLTAPQTITGIDGGTVDRVSLTGTVKDAAGAPITSGSVYAYEFGVPYNARSASIGSAGTYQFANLAPGSYQLRVVPRDHLAQWWDNAATQATAQAVTVSATATATADFAVARGGTIQGTVTDEATGQGLDQFYVQVSDSTTGNSVESRSYYSTSGAYSLSGLPDGTYRIHLSSSRYLPEYWDDQPDGNQATLVTISGGNTVTGIDAALTLGGTISGRVTDDATGAALPNINVEVIQGTDGYGPSNTTNADGTFSVSGLAAGQYTVRFTNYGGRYVGAWYDGVTARDAATPVSVTLGQTTSGIDQKLTLGGVVTGKVTDATGAAVTDASIVLYDLAGNRVGTNPGTRSDGTYATAAVPAGQYKVAFERWGRPTVYYNGKADLASADPITVVSGRDTTGIDAVLPPDVIAGKVVDASTNAALEGACVFLYTTDGTYAGHMQCVGADGVFSFQGMTGGTYQVVASDPAGTHRTLWGQTVSFPVGASDLTLAMEPITTLMGVVTDDRAALLEGVCAYLYPVGSDQSTAASCTLADGRIVMQDLPAGQYQLAYADTAGLHRTTWYGGTADRAASTTLTVAQGSIITLDNVAMPTITTVIGVVKDNHGTPLAGVCAYLYPVGSDQSAAASCTGADGRIVMQDLPAGQYQLAVADPAALHETTWFGDSGQRSGATTVTVATGTVSRSDVTMPAIKTVIAIAQDDATGQPLAGACGYLFPVGSDTSAAGSCAGADGRLVFQHVPAGQYQLAVVDPSGVRATMWTGGHFSRASAGTIDLAAHDASTDAVFPMEAVGSVTGRVVDAAGQPLAGVCVYADFLDGSYAHLGTCTGADGTWAFTGVSPTGYKVAFYPADGSAPTWWGGVATEADGSVVSVAPGTATALGDMTLGAAPQAKQAPTQPAAVEAPADTPAQPAAVETPAQPTPAQPAAVETPTAPAPQVPSAEPTPVGELVGASVSATP